MKRKNPVWQDVAKTKCIMAKWVWPQNVGHYLTVCQWQTVKKKKNTW